MTGDELRNKMTWAVIGASIAASVGYLGLCVVPFGLQRSADEAVVMAPPVPAPPPPPLAPAPPAAAPTT